MAMIGAWVRTFFSRFLLLVLLLVFSPFFFVVLLFPSPWFYRSRIFFWGIDFFYWAVVTFSLLPIRYKGLKNVPDENAVFAANHQSSLDIPLVGRVVGTRPHVWLATEELTQSWGFRLWLPRMPNAFLINPENPRKAMRTLIKTIHEARKNRLDIMIFPEGMRHTDGEIHDFFMGFAVLARRMRRPVVPVRIFGAYKVYPPNTFWVQYYPITVVVGKPMYVKSGETNKEFADRVRAWFLEQTEDE